MFQNRFASWTFFLLIAACALSFFTYRDYSRGNALRKDGVEADAVVTEIKESRGRKGRTNYTPVVTFTNQSGGQVTTPTSSSSNYTQGQKVKVTYLPSDTKVCEMSDGHVVSGNGVMVMAGISAILWIGTIGCGALAFISKAAAT